ncbi:hypothetical protein HAX54_012428 [Datura stramonium]|uniref:Uncharacterized protein n=1 Tax=Datura stramonium TaxID=4076 RepID=A0ABS8TLC1_DATST|nr:hypothetical protein [Datura stramonium]
MTHIVEKNNQQQEEILENVWANFISKNDQNSQRVTNDQCYNEKYWEQLPILERLPSLGRWISMGAETWEEILDGINIIPPNDNKNSNDESTSKLDESCCQEAAMAYDKAALRIRGPKAYLNFPHESTVAHQAIGISNNCPHDEKEWKISSSIEYNSRKRASRDWNMYQDLDEINLLPVEKRILRSMEEAFCDHLDILEFEDLGSDYLDSLLSSL